MSHESQKTQYVLAPLGKRSTAFFLDCVVVVVISLGWKPVAFRVLEEFSIERTNTSIQWVLGFPMFAYFFLFALLPGRATLGMRLSKIKIASSSHRPLHSIRLLIRSLVLLFPLFLSRYLYLMDPPDNRGPGPDFRGHQMILPILVVFYLIIAFVDDRNQSIHDMAGGTLVIRRGENRGPASSREN